MGAGCLAMHSALQKGGVQRDFLLLSRYIVKKSQFIPYYKDIRVQLTCTKNLCHVVHFFLVSVSFLGRKRLQLHYCLSFASGA